MRPKFKLWRVFPVLLLLASCTTMRHPAEQLVDRGEWLQAVLEYREAYASNPHDVEFKSRLQQVEQRAADYYYIEGMKSYERGLFDDAVFQYQQGLIAKPGHQKLRKAIKNAIANKEADYYYREGLNLQGLGKVKDALSSYTKALGVFPGHAQSRAAIELVRGSTLKNELNDGWGRFNKKISLTFRGTDLRTAFEFIGKSFKMNIIFDEGVKGTPVTIFAKDITFIQALSLLGTTTKTFYKKIGPKTIIIAPDKPDKRGQYEDYITRVFYLKAANAKNMYDEVKGLLSPKKIVIEPKSNALLIRDTADVLSLAENIISANDRKPPELVLDVEILEVNRSKADKFGLDLGTYEIGAGIPTSTPIPASGSIPDSVSALANLTLPSATLRFYRQQVDAKTLANPRIRTLNNEPAHIHIGDRVPLQASRIIDATGQVRTTFDYREIGISLNVDPKINLDNSVQVKLALEVSSLGENLGTANEPAYRIGTRNAETVMLLRDGETAILGGLIRDEDRTTRLKVPGLGDIPVVGTIFTSHDIGQGRTDVLLTITPRVIRGWDLPRSEERQFYSGSSTRYLDRPLFGEQDFTQKTSQPKASVTTSVAPVSVGFTKDSYKMKMGQETTLDLIGKLPEGHGAGVFEVRFDPQVMQFVKLGSTDGESAKLSANKQEGVIRLEISSGKSDELAKLVFSGIKKGASYLTINSRQFADGVAVGVEPRPASVLVE